MVFVSTKYNIYLKNLTPNTYLNFLYYNNIIKFYVLLTTFIEDIRILKKRNLKLISNEAAKSDNLHEYIKAGNIDSFLS